MPNTSQSKSVSVEETKSELSLPLARVRNIMKSSADPSVPMIKFETLHLVSRATEMLIKMLAKKSIGKNKSLEYKHVADFVQSDNTLEFLHSIVPKKITVKTFLKLQNDTDKSDNSGESDSSSSSSSDDDESSSSDSEASTKADAESKKKSPVKAEKSEKKK